MAGKQFRDFLGPAVIKHFHTSQGLKNAVGSIKHDTRMASRRASSNRKYRCAHARAPAPESAPCRNCGERWCRCLHDPNATDAKEDLQSAALLDVFSANNKASVFSELEREDIDKLHTVHMEALGHLERVVLALSADTGSTSADEARKKQGFMHSLLDKAKKLKDDVVASAKVLAHAAVEHQKKATDALRRSSVGKAVNAARAEFVKAKQEHAAHQAAIEHQAAEDLQAQDKKARNQPSSNEYMTALPLLVVP
jgi:hypothetical protein